MATFQPGIPTGLVPFNQDYLNVQGNFSQLNTQFNIDHVPLTSTSGTPPNGYHTAIHLVPQTSITNTPGYGQFYSQTISDVNTDQALFFNSGTGNRTVQLTVPIVPTWNSGLAQGYTFLAGGFLLQWGYNSASNNTLIMFPQAFPTAAYTVTIIPSNATTGSYYVAGLNTLGWRYGKTTVGTDNVYWMAIGK